MKFSHFDQLLTKEMTRKDFLLHLGVLFLVITGISNLLKTLSDPHITKQIGSKPGFGSGPYGA